MRIIRQPWGLALLLAASLIASSGVARAETRPVVRLDSEVKDGVVRLVAQSTAPFQYTTSRPNRSLFVLDLSGVSAPQASSAKILDSDLVSGYRVLSYATGEKSVVRIEVRMSAVAEPVVERQGPNELTVVVANGRGGAKKDDAPKPSADSEAPTAVPTSANTNSDARAAIEHVRLEQAGNDTAVNVTGDGPLTYHVLRLSNPDRIVLDFSGTHVKTSEHNIASNLDPVRQVQAGAVLAGCGAGGDRTACAGAVYDQREGEYGYRGICSQGRRQISRPAMRRSRWLRPRTCARAKRRSMRPAE